MSKRAPIPRRTPRSRYLFRVIAAEISEMTRFYDQVLQWHRLAHDDGFLLQETYAEGKGEIQAQQSLPDLRGETERRTAILLNGNLNHDFDIQGLLAELKPKLSRTSRVIAVAFNPYLAWAYRLATWLRLRTGEMPSTFITRTDLMNLARLAGYDVARIRPVGYFPWRLLGLGDLINRWMPVIPLLKWLSFTVLITLRPLLTDTRARPSLTIVIPARNEKGNIEAALQRMPDLGTQLEIIFVEGHSSDGTWEEIQRVKRAYEAKYRILAFQQTGKGKADAVRLGFSKATADLLTILDADLTMPPELLGRFYSAYCEGLADFVNGTRLVYPMEGEAMRFLNRLGNTFFAKALSHVLDARLGDSLCGTKLVARHDYSRMVRWRDRFGDFDPFGDFELIFPAAVLGFGAIDIPIRYRARTYGSTNISRFRNGWQLLRMTVIGFFKIKLGRTSAR